MLSFEFPYSILTEHNLTFRHHIDFSRPGCRPLTLKWSWMILSAKPITHPLNENGALLNGIFIKIRVWHNTKIT